jgi:membrane dipeptidase
MQYLALESARLLGFSHARLKTLAGAGIRYTTFTHNSNNSLGDSATDAPRWKGLSPFGKSMIGWCDDLGVLCDISHASDAAAWVIVEKTKNPPIASHSGSRTLHGHIRNLPDELIRAVADKHGVVHVPFAANFMGVHSVADHIDYIAQLVGNPNHVGVGSDLDGALMVPECPNVTYWSSIIHMDLQHKGFTDAEIDLISGGNTQRVFESVQKVNQ